jgi:hypothetical protein
MPLSINIVDCLPPSSGKLRREKRFSIGKGASQKLTAPSTVGEKHCVGTPPIHCFPLQFILLPFYTETKFSPEKLTNSSQTTRRHTPENSNLRRTIKLYLRKKKRYEAVHWIHLVPDRDKWRYCALRYMECKILYQRCTNHRRRVGRATKHFYSGD